MTLAPGPQLPSPADRGVHATRGEVASSWSGTRAREHAVRIPQETATSPRRLLPRAATLAMGLGPNAGVHGPHVQLSSPAGSDSSSGGPPPTSHEGRRVAVTTFQSWCAAGTLVGEFRAMQRPPVRASARLGQPFSSPRARAAPPFALATISPRDGARDRVAHGERHRRLDARPGPPRGRGVRT